MYAFVLGILVGGLLTVAICLLTMPSRPRHHHHRREDVVVPVVVEIEDLSSPEQVESMMSGKEPAVIMVHSPHCGHCVAMKPNFEAAVKAYKSSSSKPVRVARIDARVAGSDFMKKYEVRGVPHVMGHKANGNGSVKYSGDRSPDSLKNFMLEMA